MRSIDKSENRNNTPFYVKGVTRNLCVVRSIWFTDEWPPLFNVYIGITRVKLVRE